MSENQSEHRTVGDALRDCLGRRGWTQADLAQVIGKTTAAVNEIIQGKRSVSPEMAALFSAAFNTSAGYWLVLDAGTRVTEEELEEARRRARLYHIAPVREMVRRGWIKPAADLAGVEAELKAFFRVVSLEHDPILSVATRRQAAEESPLSSQQRAWCFRARNLAADLLAPPFDDRRVDECEEKLKGLLAHAPEAAQISRLLATFGVRFVVIEPLSESKIDGAALWLDDKKPVIALSLRRDRIDSLWFTLFHEWSHIRHKDGLSIDSRLTGEDAIPTESKPSFEQRADSESAASLIPPDSIDSFIRRIAPFYSKERIIQFAHRNKVHPGIVVGQLQHRRKIRWSANREMLAKIRQRVISTSVVDGWGNTIG
ncbi:MAG TPA: helix-turn-helix domain-containing protein [Phycisphaerae bacterium]|nr:helix-turn-helix domain-containing protein [Phycisphaerae bacterium]